MSLAQRVRDGEAEQVAAHITAAELHQIDNAGVPLVHQFALQGKLSAIAGKLTPKLLETTWGPGWTVAHTAAAVGDAAPLKKALQKNKHLLYWADQQGQTPLHIAALHGHLDQFDIEAFQLTVRDNLFTTPMHYAAASGCLCQIGDSLTPEMLLMINWNEESVLDLLNKTKQPRTPALEDAIWETEYLTNPAKRSWENVMQHLGITQ
jgi:hypothetical protein